MNIDSLRLLIISSTLTIFEDNTIFISFIFLIYIYLFIKFPTFKKTSFFLKNFLISYKTHKITFYSGSIILFLSVLSILLNKPYLVIGHMQDMWIPKVGAYAIKHGLSLHQDFHTPFGFVYNGINYISMLIIEAFPNIFNLFDMIMLSSVLFLLIVIGLFYLMKFNTSKAIPITLLLVILSIIPQLKPMYDTFNFQAPASLWHASYNKHLWGLFLLQIVHLFCWRKFFVKNVDSIEENGKKSFILFLTIQIICAYIFFNYKINFFIGSSLVIFSIFLIIPFKFWLKYITFSISLFLFLILSTSILSGYSYIGYLKDIYHVILSRRDVYLDLDYFFIYLFTFFLMRIYVELFKKTSKEKKTIEFLKYYFYKSKLFLVSNKFILTKWFLLDLCIAAFLSIGIAVDKERSLFYFLIAIISYLIINIRTLTIGKGFYWILTILFVINASFLVNIYFGLNYFFAYLLIFSLIRICILLSLKRLSIKNNSSDFLKYYFYKFKLFLERKLSKIKLLDFSYYLYNSKSFLTNNNFSLIKHLLFDLCIGFSILICITGNGEKPSLYFLIVFLFYLIINTNIINIKRVCYLVLAILFTINTSSLVKVAFFKFYKKEQLTNNQFKHQKYKAKSIITNNKNYSFVIENKDNMKAILNELKTHHPDKYKNLFEGVVYDDGTLNHKMHNNNVYYIDYLNDIFFIFHNKLDKHNKFLILEALNPLPILLDTKPIKGSYHWFHPGFTFSSKTIHRFNKTFEGSDFVYMPLFSILSRNSLLRCHFHKWNFQHKQFVLSSIHKYGFLFATPQKIKEYDLENLEFPNPSKIKESCLTIENEQKEIEQNQRKNILTRLLQRFPF